jgi:hypothetical protein
MRNHELGAHEAYALYFSATAKECQTTVFLPSVVWELVLSYCFLTKHQHCMQVLLTEVPTTEFGGFRISMEVVSSARITVTGDIHPEVIRVKFDFPFRTSTDNELLYRVDILASLLLEKPLRIVHRVAGRSRIRLTSRLFGALVLALRLHYEAKSLAWLRTSGNDRERKIIISKKHNSCSRSLFLGLLGAFIPWFFIVQCVKAFAR